MLVVNSRFKSIFFELLFILFIIFLFIILGCFLLPGPYNFSREINLYDEGILLTGAKRLLFGEIPYRDFWTLYSPLNYLTIAAFFKIFEPTILAERIHNVFISILCLLPIYGIFRIRTNFYISGLLCLSFLLFPSPLKLIHLFLFICIFLILNFLKNTKNEYLPYLLGLVCGLSFLTRLDFGLLISSLTFFVVLLSNYSNLKLLFKNILKLFFSFLLVILPFFLWLAFNDSLMLFLIQTIYYPFIGNFVDQRKLPFTFFSNFFFNFYCFISIIFFTFLLFLKSERALYLYVFLFLILGSLPYMFQRYDSPHINFVNILCFVFTTYTLLCLKNSKYKIVFFLIPVLFLSNFIVNQLPSYNEHKFLELKQYSFYSFPLPDTEANDNLSLTLNYLNENVPSNEPIFIGLTDTSKIFISNVLLYFLLDNPIPTFYHELHPGVANTKEVQLEILYEIENVNYIVLWDGFYCEPNISCNSSNIFLVDNYIKENFLELIKFGKYSILIKKS